MISSMTGYGRAQALLNGREITIEIKAVNHRYFEYGARLPRAFSYLEDEVKKAVAEAVSRGKIEVNISVQNVSAQDTIITINKDIAKAYYEALSQMAEELDIPNDIKATTLSRFGDIFAQTKVQNSEDTIKLDILSTLQEAINSFKNMRANEGEKLKGDILGKLAFLEEITNNIEKKAEERASVYYDKLYQKMQAILNDTQIDEVRVLQEAAIYADRASVDEEIVRLKSHITQYRDLLETHSAIGKKLDFLTQELNREINTIGSKANDLQITNLVINAKSEVEKIREQIQNIE